METLKVSSFFNLRIKISTDDPLSRAFLIRRLNPTLASHTARVNNVKSI